MLENYIGKIINADCMDILKQLPDKCIDLVLTDPPYRDNKDNRPTMEVRGEEKVYHAAMMEAIRYMAHYKKDGKIKLVFEEI